MSAIACGGHSGRADAVRSCQGNAEDAQRSATQVRGGTHGGMVPPAPERQGM
jgi:hypothetical protein